MGSSKKRDSSSVGELEGRLDTSTDNVVPKSSKKKMKKENKKDADMVDAVDAASDNPDAVKPMERRKKRKSLDKERKRDDSVNKKPKPKQVKADVTLQPQAAPATSGLPEFHISVFTDLASADVCKREAAAEAMVNELLEVQKKFEKLEEKQVVEGGLQLEAEKDDGLNNCAPALGYAVRRLIRGVSSSRECARQGFALGLSVLVGTIPSIKVDSILKLIVKLLEVNSSMKGQEARDCLLGRLFAYGALARSGRLNQEWILDENTPYIKEFTSLVLSLGIKKRYLQEPAVSVILDLVEKLPTETLTNHVLEAPELHEWFKGATEIGNPDALLLALKLREKVFVDSSVFSKILPHPFSPDKLFAANHVSSLVNCLKESTFCQPRIHSVWPVLVNILLPDTVLQEEEPGLNSSKKQKKSRKCNSSKEIAENFRCFCEVFIEGSLLLSSHDRKHLAFDVLLLLLPRMPATFVSIILSDGLVQCLMDVLSTKDSWLYKVAQNFLKELSEWAKFDDVKRAAVIVALQKHSNARFDSITRTKTVKDLMAEFKTESGCMLFIQNLMSIFLDEGHASDEPSDQSQTTDDNSEMGSIEEKDSTGMLGNSDLLKTWVIESLSSILKYVKLEPEAKFRVQKEILKNLVVQGLFSASLGTEVTSFELQEKFSWPKAATSIALCRMCIEQLQLLLENAQKGEKPLVANTLEQNSLGSVFTRYLGALCNIPSVSLFRSLSNEDDKALKKLQSMEMRLSREERNCDPKSTEAKKLYALRYLLIQLLLQMLLRPGEFSEAAFELTICCKKVLGAPDFLLDSSGEDEIDGDETPELMDVLVETLLSLLPQSSSPMRFSIEQVFKYFCEDVTDEGLLQMLRVIKKDLKPARRNVEKTDSQDEDDDDDDDFLEIAEDVESDEGETGETGEDDEQSDDDTEAVGVKSVEKDIPEGSDDDSDSGMDDEAMFRMDTYLAKIFKERKKLAGGETSQSELILFKLRVLSLLEIYLDKNQGKPQVLTVYSNLAQAFLNPHASEGSVQLEERVWTILKKKIFKVKEYPKGEGVGLSTLESLLEKKLKLALKALKIKKSFTNSSKKQQAALNWPKKIASLAQDSTFWILGIIDAQDLEPSEVERVVGIFKLALGNYFKQSQLKTNFLKEIFKRRPWIGHHLFYFLLETCESLKSEFRRVEVLDLVKELLKLMFLAAKKKKSNVENSGEEAPKEMLKSHWPKLAPNEILKSHLPKLCCVIEKLVRKMPEKQSRRAEVRKFCLMALKVVSDYNLNACFLQELSKDARTACETQLGQPFLCLYNKE